LPSLDDLPDLPVYGRGPRVRTKNLRGPFQEIQIDVHSFDEIDKPQFWKFLKRAVEGFEKFTEKAATRPEDVMPWKKLGQKWHFARKGFPPGKRVDWEPEVLEELCELLSETASDGQFLWNNQQVVHLFVPESRDPWASIYTKRPGGLDLLLNGPEGRFALGRIAKLARQRKVEASQSGRDQIKLRFRTLDDLHQGDLADFLTEHLEAVRNGSTIRA